LNTFTQGLVHAASEAFALAGPVLEVGSYQVPGQEGLANLRPFFSGQPYVGIDVRPGPGVDVLADVEALPQPDHSFATALAIGTFEHVPRFWEGFAELHRVLRPEGALLVASPFYFRIHAHPNDYWRFSPEGLKVLLADYPSKIIGWQGPARRPAHAWALAFREEHPAITPAQYQHFQELLTRHARLPPRWGRRLRYQLGRLLFGSRPFAPYLEREKWDCVCLNEPVQDLRRHEIPPEPLVLAPR
jgi:SAM-dependent methyltransferase